MASFSVGVREFDRRHFEHVRAQIREPLGERAGLSRAPRDDNAFSEQRQIFKPVQLPAQLHHVADDGERGREIFFSAASAAIVASVPATDFCCR